MYSVGAGKASDVNQLASKALEARGPCCHACPAGETHFWANDKPNHECAETCFDASNKLLRAEGWVLTGGQGQEAAAGSSPCASAGFTGYNRTDTVGLGPLTLKLDKYVAPRPSSAEAAIVEAK